MKQLLVTIHLLIVSLSAFAQKHELQNQLLENYQWSSVTQSQKVKGRHETSFVLHKDKFYLIGGRESKAVEVFDPSSNTWTKVGDAPFFMHHFQAVSYHDHIYFVGAMKGNYPVETPLEHIWTYQPEKNEWKKQGLIPKEVRRGGGGAVLYQDKIYLACGITNGHTSGCSNRFDVYDLSTNTWEQLTSAPHLRDHFNAVVANDKLYLIGGRNSSVHHKNNFTAFFKYTNPFVDVYDFKTQQWITLEDRLPYPSAAGGVIKLDNYLIYMGGENAQPKASSKTQVLELTTHKWSLMSDMIEGRHGTNAILYKGSIYVFGGSPVRGGGRVNTMEKLGK
ncbi:kelch repeat-containing protein [Flammeovirga sp. EKP202]|uniref:Kelch repeat-containing protein n=1 Tax=Flammeovirga sp. EKP202 TaxID=2770592 RepID=UPI00165F24E4|nr:kelch repeat-containing protein [Flammeovirga sp. EKP202]MBD0405079.1 galactose oxidase [Flammeovirga sp. EKP202]